MDVVEGGRDRTAGTGDRCLACGASLVSAGIQEFRTGGTTGGWKLLFGEWAELGEEMVPLEVFACPSCRRVELRTPPPSR